MEPVHLFWVCKPKFARNRKTAFLFDLVNLLLMSSFIREINKYLFNIEWRLVLHIKIKVFLKTLQNVLQITVFANKGVYRVIQ